MSQPSSINILLLILLLGHSSIKASAWIPASSQRATRQQATGIQSRWIGSFSHKSKCFQELGPLFASTSEETEDALASVLSKLRVSEIKQELEALKVDYTDCFDKESMVARLLEARNKKDENVGDAKEPSSSSPASSSADAPSSEGSNGTKLDEEAELEKIRSMRVKELREELGRRRIPRAGLFDKEDLVQALWKAKQLDAVFSATGNILPGCVADLSEDDVEKELQHTATPLLLDVYATWCGPCQMIAPLLEQAAQESFSGGSDGDVSKPLVRVAKMDSDANPQMASKLKVAGLPTLVLFQHGEEIDRLEGAPMKDQLVDWVTRKLQ
ncbi:unnamed protein product [Cylindrotheca closterium]|uniref:Thioredoxin domain-containing protein n=1 Tax=Cylindrotheca closterium TaxID=2856 RepID=A0AAD2JHQ9_9STRA|nr:unnamed protein product [Cylindrotheca closterium]